MMFEKLQIIVSSEEEREELLRGCKHIHDFTVWLQDKVKVTDEFGIAKEGCDVVRDMGEEDCGVWRDMDEKVCGVCLNFDKYPFVNFLAGLYDCEDKSVRDEYIKIEPSEKKKYNPSKGLPIGFCPVTGKKL